MSTTATPNAAQLRANSWLFLKLKEQHPVPGAKISLNTIANSDWQQEWMKGRGNEPRPFFLRGLPKILFME
jgi:hypothetical protein